jgi:hypothetical protein
MANFVVLELCGNDGYLITAQIDGSPRIPKIYSFSGENGVVMCGTSIEDSDVTIASYTAITEYEECFDCVEEHQFSANTEYILCLPDCSGTTVSLELPHPVWTNNYGQAVVQLNAVELGGINGLNN